jgi:hypothetical protein
MKSVQKKIAGPLKVLAMIVAGVLLGAILITLVYCIPVNQTNAQKSIDSLEGEGWYPSATQLKSSLDTYFHSYLPGVLDGATDGLMLEKATRQIEGNPLWEAMNMEGYTYYWHGYVVILRVLLLFMDYEQFRFLNCILQLMMMFFVAHFIWEKKGQRYALALLTSYFLMMPMAMFLSLQFSWIFYIAMALSLLICYRHTWFTEKRIPYIFVIVGMLTSFFDLLTYPLYTWAFPLLLLILLSEDGQKALNYVKTVVVSGLGWILGYAGMWFGKWALAGWIVHRNVIQEAWKEVLFRSGSEESLNLIARLEALYDNWKHYEYPLYTALLAIWLTWFIYKSLNGKTQIVRQEKNGAYLLITLSSFVWYFVLANHTLGHHFFTYRIWGVAITGILFLFCGSIAICKDNCSGRDRIYTFCKWGILCILAVMLTLTAREDVSVLNGNVEYQEIELPKGEQIEEEFLPSFPRVKNFAMGIRTESVKGQCIIEIRDDEKTLYELNWKLAELADTEYVQVPVDWNFKRDSNYRIVIHLEENEGPVYLRFTKDNVNPMLELGVAKIGGDIISGQLTSGIVYSYRPLSKYTLLFLTISWLGLLTALSFEVEQIVMWVFHRLKGKSGSV